MKPIHLIAGLGGLAIAAAVAWLLYMQANPPYETAEVRGLDPIPGAASEAPKSAEAPPGTATP